jgi:FkbM family methyltransferase
MRKVLSRLLQSKSVQIAVKLARLPQLVNLGLCVTGVTRRIRGTDLRYRLRFADSILLMDGLLNGGEYSALQADAGQIETLIDLGCNVGFFPLYLCMLRGDKQLRGLLVDANPAVVQEAKENLKLNHLHELEVLHGLADGESSDPEGEFFVTQNSMSSTAHADLIGTRLGVRRLVVPRIQIQQEFTRRFGPETPVDLLKLDIEGSELTFLHANPALLKRCHRIILEYHTPRVAFGAVEQTLGPVGFTCQNHRKHPNEPWGMAYFVRQNSSPPEE